MLFIVKKTDTIDGMEYYLGSTVYSNTRGIEVGSISVSQQISWRELKDDRSVNDFLFLVNPDFDISIMANIRKQYPDYRLFDNTMDTNDGQFEINMFHIEINYSAVTVDNIDQYRLSVAKDKLTPDEVSLIEENAPVIPPTE